MITKKDLKIIEEKESMLDIITFEPSSYTIPMDKLEGELEKFGMLDMYKKWDEFLRENHFRFAHPIIADLRDGALTYVRETDLSVKGDHSQDCVVLYAYLTAEKVLFLYDSSILNYYHVDYEDDLDGKLNAFYKKKFDYINYYPPTQKIEIHKIGGNYYFIAESSDMLYFRFDDFARLAITLDIEMNKRHPFCDVREYEERERKYLARALSGEGFHHYGFEHYSDGCVQGMIVGSSYTQTREECLERAKAVLHSLNSENESLRDGAVEAVCRLETMTDEEFSAYKEEVFDV